MTGEVLGDLYARYRVELRRFLWRQSRSPHDAEDLLHLMYVQLLRFPPTETVREPLNYLYRIAWHVVRQANRRTQQEDEQTIHGGLEILDRMGMASSGDTSEQVCNEQLLQQILGRLPPGWQEAILLLRRDGLTYKEIAAVMGISVHTVKKYVAGALAQFKAHLKATERDR